MLATIVDHHYIVRGKGVVTSRTLYHFLKKPLEELWTRMPVQRCDSANNCDDLEYLCLV